MKDQLKLPELLSPAGSIDHLKAAINAGADAVYIGGDRFSARAYAQNFSGDRIREALHYAHFYDRRIYLTVNTLNDLHLQHRLLRYGTNTHVRLALNTIFITILLD